MFRRKLALYTLLYTAGITAGFFVFERSRAIEAAGFCAAVIAAVLFSFTEGDGGICCRRNTGSDTDYTERHLNIRKETVSRQKSILLLAFLTGFMMFAFRSLSYSSSLPYISDKNYIRGTVSSVSVKHDKVRMIVKNSGKGPARVLVTIDEDSAEKTAGLAGSYYEKAYERSGPYGFTGEKIEARGKFAEISSADDPGCFDYGLYMKSKGVTVKMKAYIFEVTDTDVSLHTRMKSFLYSTRESFISRFDEETQGFIRGVIFGDKSEIDEDLLEEFNSNSTGHILAVSGLHMGFLYGLLRFLTSRRKTLPVSALITAIILLYGEMTMWSPATVRACIVMIISLCSTHFRRCADLLTSVSFAALVILTFQPYQLFNSGFQLSFLALCGIAFLTGPIASVTGEAAAVMLAVQTGTMPVIAFSYCMINPLSILINVPVILLASVLVPVCMLLLISEAATGRVPAAGIDFAELISFAVIKINHVLNFDGSFSLKTAGAGAAVIIVAYVIIFGLASEWTRVMLLRKDHKTIMKQGILLMMPLAMLFSCLYDTIADDEIVFVAVGQGDCVHIRAEGHDLLIDGGGQMSFGKHSDSEDEGDTNTAGAHERENESDKTDDRDNEGYNVGKSILMPYLMHGGADAVDIALVTHLHADHYKGIKELSEVFPVGAIGIPVDYRITDAGTSENKNTPSDIFFDRSKVYYIKPDTEIDVTDDVSIDVVWPVEVSDEPLSADDPNEHNTVYMIHYRGIKIMVTGDLLEEDELDMAEYYEGTDTLKCDILKVAHHGSKSSSSEAFLDAADPDIAVIQCGRNNFYGHPHKQTLERLEERGIRVFRTDISGAVGIDIRSRRLAVDLYK